jgi:hypothetical protein
MRYRHAMTGRGRQWRATPGLVALAFALALLWPGAATAAWAGGADGAGRLGAMAPAAADHGLALRGQPRPGGLAADRRGPAGATPLGVVAGVLAGAMLVAAAALRGKAARPRRRGRLAPAAPRAPPFLQPA